MAFNNTQIFDVANWVALDLLQRPDQLANGLCQSAALDTYNMVCAAVPFDELQATSQEFNLVANQDTYTLGVDFVLSPVLRAIANIRITFDVNNKRRLRRSHVRVYDALSITPASRPATYARWDNQLQFNPPPDSSVYTVRFRYWSKPTIGIAPAVITGVTFGSPNAIYTTSTNHGFGQGDVLTVQGVTSNGAVNPANLSSWYNFTRLANTAVTANTFTVNLGGTATPGTFIAGGLATDNTSQWLHTLVTPLEWNELMKYETLYRVLQALGRYDQAQALVTPQGLPRQGSANRKQRMFEMGIIPRLWNDLLFTSSQKENVDEDFNINPVIRPYSFRS